MVKYNKNKTKNILKSFSYVSLGILCLLCIIHISSDNKDIMDIPEELINRTKELTETDNIIFNYLDKIDEKSWWKPFKLIAKFFMILSSPLIFILSTILCFLVSPIICIIRIILYFLKWDSQIEKVDNFAETLLHVVFSFSLLNTFKINKSNIGLLLATILVFIINIVTICYLMI